MKNIVFKIIYIVIGIAIIGVLIMLISKVTTAVHPKQEPKSAVATSTPTISPQEFNQQVVAKIKQTILDYYHVTEFPEILYQDSENMIGYLVDITPTDPNQANGEFTLHFRNSWGTTSQTQAHQIAQTVMKIVGPKVDEVNAIWARFDTYAGKLYYNERAGREVLGNE
ncbi:MAG: hypothetical protein LBI63_05275 [Candidatus Ancillula sp.]|jgi:hypothetical protein|nr:hypothetical protein [Candidatus Ancillula sp.]